MGLGMHAVAQIAVRCELIRIIATSSMAMSIALAAPVRSRWNSAADSAKAPVMPVA